MTNATPNRAPVIASGGITAPIEVAPKNANSKVAPTVIPVFISPIAIPTIKPTIIGCDIKFLPPAYSTTHNTNVITPNNIAVPMSCSPFRSS